MTRDTPDGRILTEFERLLDSHHRTLPLWSQPRAEAVFATLAAFDLFMLPIGLGVAGAGPCPASTQMVKGFHDALIHAMRFFWEDSNNVAVQPASDPRLIEQASEFLTHCGKYGLLVDMHVGLNRELYELQADEGAKSVRFVPRPADGSTPEPAGILEGTPALWDHLVGACDNRLLMADTMQIIRRLPHHFEAGRVVVDDFASVAGPALQGALDCLIPPVGVPLEDGDQLGGVSALEFRAFWRALFSWSVAATGLYLEEAYAGRSQYEHLPTQHVARGRFVEVIRQLSGLPEEPVTACLDRLSFGRGCPKKPDIYLQPLLCAGGHVAWSPYLVQLCRHERNMLKLMARLPALKPLADNLIGGGRERAVTRGFCLLLARHGYQFKTRVPLPDGSGEVDLMAFHARRPTELLVVEVKGVLGVDEVNEVDHATREMIVGQSQLRNAIAFLRGADDATKAGMWRGAPWHAFQAYYGVVLTPDAQPHAGYDHRELPAVALETVERYFRERDFKSPCRFWTTCTKKRWLRRYADSPMDYTPVRVGDVTYLVPYSHPGDANAEHE